MSDDESMFRNTIISKEELAALRARVADLELMLRALKVRSPYQRAFLNSNGDKHWSLQVMQTNEAGCYTGEYQMFDLADDGTGLPILTDEARKALEKP